MHEFVAASQREIEAEYQRIQKHVSEDPGTAGDQGEENWAQLLREWLPSYFTVVTKGRILTQSNYRSPQMDVIVLKPSYPPLLQSKKLYLASGVAAAFECKITLKSNHIQECVSTSALIKRSMPVQSGTAFKDLHSPIITGLLAHSHSWKSENSQPCTNIGKTLREADLNSVEHPRETLDFICIADLAVWNIHKITYAGPSLSPLADLMMEMYGVDGKTTATYTCSQIGGEYQKDYFSPVGSFLYGLFSRLAWEYPDMRPISSYMANVGLGGAGKGHPRLWETSVLSELVRHRIRTQGLENGVPYSEWSLGF